MPCTASRAHFCRSGRGGLRSCAATGRARYVVWRPLTTPLLSGRGSSRHFETWEATPQPHAGLTASLALTSPNRHTGHVHTPARARYVKCRRFTPACASAVSALTVLLCIRVTRLTDRVTRLQEPGTRCRRFTPPCASAVSALTRHTHGRDTARNYFHEACIFS